MTNIYSYYIVLWQNIYSQAEVIRLFMLTYCSHVAYSVLLSDYE
jgi:hypothetical protein